MSVACHEVQEREDKIMPLCMIWEQLMPDSQLYKEGEKQGKGEGTRE